tara:strand:+ start:1837 stop:2034 length:198 start_codon:yes stop_codon:yes gene_type:complete
MNKAQPSKINDIFGTVEMELISIIKKDLVRGRGTIGDAVDEMFSQHIGESEHIRTVTVHIDEEKA